MGCAQLKNLDAAQVASVFTFCLFNGSVTPTRAAAFLLLPLTWLSNLTRSLRCGLRAPRLWRSPTCSIGIFSLLYMCLHFFHYANDTECKILALKNASSASTILVPCHTYFLFLSADSTIHSIFRPFCWRKQVPGSLCIQGLPHFAASSLVCHTSFFSQWTVHGGPANGEHQVANSGTAAQWHEHVNAEGSIAFHFKTVYVHNCRASLSLCLCKSQHS